MKNFILFCGILFSFNCTAQFSESFFERMSSGDFKPGHFFGTEISNGALGVRFADSVDTEVQWAKLDLHGNFQTYSAHLPNDYISPNERIIEVYESGINQFIVTQDSASNNQEGIRVYKYENYTQSAGVFEFPVQLRNAYFQSYFMYGKIYVFYVESGVGMKRLKINPTTLALEENLFLGAFSYDTQHIGKHYKETHVLFQDANNMQVFASAGGSLVRINIVNNIPNPVEIKNLNLIKIFGVNPYNNQVICLTTAGINKVKKYHVLLTEPLEQLILQDSLSLSTSINTSAYNWNYANNGGSKEIFVIKGIPSIASYFENNLLVESRDDFNIYNISHVDFLNDKPIVYADNNQSLNFENYPTFSITYGEISDLFKFKEYNGIYDFGAYNLKFGTGLNFVQPIYNSAIGDFIFSHLDYASGLAIRAKENNTIYGEDVIYANGSYKPGPYTNMNQYDHDIIHHYNESFYVDRDMLNYHVYAIENNIPNYEIPRGILYWPAHGVDLLNFSEVSIKLCC